MKSMELQQTIEDLKAGDRLALSKFLTHVETSANPIELVLKLYNKVDRITPIIGVTGFPGAGKSSLINSFISILRLKEKKIGNALTVKQHSERIMLFNEYYRYWK